MKNALARLEALERGTPGDKLLIVTEVVTPHRQAVQAARRGAAAAARGVQLHALAWSRNSAD